MRTLHILGAAVMLRKIIASIILILLFLIAVSAESQQPKPNKQAVEQKANQSNDDKKIGNTKDYGADNTRILTGQTTIPINPPPPPDLQKTTQDKCYYCNQNPKEGWVDILRNPVAVFTGIIAIFTILLVVAGFRQVAISRDIAIRQLRAYINVKSASIYNVTGPIGPQIHIMFDNFGQTPAYDVIDISQVCFLEFPLKSILDSDSLGGNGLSLPPGKSVIPPGGGYDKIDNLGRSLIPMEIASLKAVKTAIYVHGKITYKDTFGKKRFTKYRLRHSGDFGPIGKSTVLITCENGNEVD